MSGYTNDPAFVFNTNDPNLTFNINVNPDQAIIGTGATQGVSNSALTANYYTIAQVNAIALSGSSIDLSDYYTKEESDSTFFRQVLELV